MKTRSRALSEWRQEARRSRANGVREKRSVVHYANTAGFLAAGKRRSAGGHPARRFAVLAALLLVCALWLAALLRG